MNIHLRFLVVFLSAFALITFFRSTGLSQVPSDRDGLLKGDEMGQATVAEVNGYPDPKSVLEMDAQLKLTAAQKKSLQDILSQTTSRAVDLGKRIVSVEEELNEAFQSGLVSAKTIQETVGQIGSMRSRLRVLHLIAHMNARGVLTTDQWRTYKELKTSARKKPR